MIVDGRFFEGNGYFKEIKMKYVYYGFGAFIGFICGVIINLIFYWVDKAGYHVMRDLVVVMGSKALKVELPAMPAVRHCHAVVLPLPGSRGADLPVPPFRLPACPHRSMLNGPA